jgi:ribonuclease E
METPDAAAPELVLADAEAKPVRRRRTKAAAAADVAPAAELVAEPELVPASSEASGLAEAVPDETPVSPRRGWWQRTFGN